MGVIRDGEIIVDVIMEQVGPAVKGIFPTVPEETELSSRQFEPGRGVEGYVFFWIKELNIPARSERMPKRLYVFFHRDALNFYADCDEYERKAIIEKVIAKIKEEYPPFAEDTDEDDHRIYFKEEDFKKYIQKGE